MEECWHSCWLKEIGRIKEVEMNRKMKQQEGLGPSEWTRLVMKVGWPVDFGLHGWVAEEAGTVVCLDQRTWCVSFMGWTWGGNCQMRGKRVRFVTSDSELTHAPTPSCTWNRNTYWDRLNLWKRGVGSRPKGWKSRKKQIRIIGIRRGSVTEG